MMQIVPTEKLTMSTPKLKNILILGDSWSQGELRIDKNKKHIVTHGGVHQYLLEHSHTVTNLGGLGESNLHAYNCYAQQTKSYDLVIWFQTEVTRDVNYNYKELFYKKLVELKSIRKVFDYILLNSYRMLDDEAKKKNEKIVVLGGFATVDDRIQDFTNLVNFVPSIISLIDPSKSFSTYSFFAPFEWFVDIIENITSDYSLEQETIDSLKEEYIRMIDENFKMIDYLGENKTYFWPDGMHPNREGHRIIFNKIKEELLND
jgi:hypothetical protein